MIIMNGKNIFVYLLKVFILNRDPCLENDVGECKYVGVKLSKPFYDQIG